MLPSVPPQVQKKTVEACRSYLELPHFNRDIIYTKSHAAAGLCEWAVNIVKYYDVVSEVGNGELGAGGAGCMAKGSAWRANRSAPHRVCSATSCAVAGTAPP